MLYWNAADEVLKQWQCSKGTCELKSYASTEKEIKP